MVQEDMWHSIQEAIEEQTGQSLPDEMLSKHFMQQLLAPGLLSQQALSQALQELDQPLASDNASIEEAQQHLTAAAQVHRLHISNYQTMAKAPVAPTIHFSIMRALCLRIHEHVQMSPPPNPFVCVNTTIPAFPQ